MKYSHGSATIIGLVILALLAIGGGGYYYYTQAIAPKRVLAKTVASLTNSNELKSFKYSGDISGTYDVQFSNSPSQNQKSQSPSGPQTFSASFNGLIDRTNPDSVEAKVNVEMNDAQQAQMTVKTRVIGSMIYLTLTGNSPAVSNLPLEEGQWISVDTADTSSESGTAGAFSGLSKLPNPNTWFKSDLSQKQKEQLQSAFRKHQFIVITDTFGKEKVTGVSSHHYGYAFKKQPYQAFLQEAQNIVGTEMLSDKQISSAEQSMKNVKTLEGEMWIGTANAYPRKLTTKMEISNEAQNTTLQDLSFEITMSEHNTDFDVSAPENAKSLSEMFNSFFPEASQQSRTQSSRETSPDKPNVPAEFDIPDSPNNSASELTEEQKQQLFEEYQGNSGSQ